MSIADKYDEKSARNHIRRVKDILNSPPVLTAQTEASSAQQINLTSSGLTTPKNEAAEQQLETVEKNVEESAAV